MGKAPFSQPETNHPLLQMLNADQLSLIEWLHNSLGQNLVAIRTFANQIRDQHRDSGDDTSEIADIISQAASISFQDSYDLMQELRAQSLANLSPAEGFQACCEQAGLAAKNIQYQVNANESTDYLDAVTRSFMLRSLRWFINYCRRFAPDSRLTVDLDPLTDEPDYQWLLRLDIKGNLDLPAGEVDGINALEARIHAMGGLLKLDRNCASRLTLNLFFNPISIS